MFIIENIISKDKCKEIVKLLEDYGWQDGHSQGKVNKDFKNNLEIPSQVTEEIKQAAMECTQNILGHEMLQLYGIIKKMTGPRFNKYSEDHAGFYKLHNDALQQGPGEGVRTDLSMTLFLTEPDTYEGGELRVYHGLPGDVSNVKPPAGSAVFYNSGDLHEVTPVTKGSRVGMIAWMQSYVKDPSKRVLLGKFTKRLKELEGVKGYELLHKDLSNIATHLQKMWSDL